MLRFDSARVRNTSRPLPARACRALRAMLSSAWMISLRSKLSVRKARIIIALDAHARRRLVAQQLVHVFADLVHAEPLRARRTEGPEHGVDEAAQPVRLADDDGGVFLQPRVVQLALQQLRRAAQSAERVLDLVRELANHEPAAVGAGAQFALARDALPGARVDELEQQLPAAEWILERRHREIDQRRGA